MQLLTSELAEGDEFTHQSLSFRLPENWSQPLPAKRPAAPEHICHLSVVAQPVLPSSPHHSKVGHMQSDPAQILLYCITLLQSVSQKISLWAATDLCSNPESKPRAPALQLLWHRNPRHAETNLKELSTNRTPPSTHISKPLQVPLYVFLPFCLFSLKCRRMHLFYQKKSKIKSD